MKRQVEEHIDKIGLNKKDAADRTKWRNVVYELSTKVRGVQALLLTETKPD